MTNNQPSTDKGNSGRAAQSNFPQRDDTTQSDYSLSQSSEKQTRDSRYSVAEEQNFDEQSDQARRVGRMPQDIGLVGFNNEPVTSLVTPQISSVEQPSFELGKMAAKLFIETVHQDKDMSDVDEILKTKLIVRESSQRLGLKNLHTK